MIELGSAEHPLRVAIVGAGPSGMYAADALFKSGKFVTVDAFDRLPTPYGLLRGGVAPDHQKMKSVGKYYDRVASNPSFSFFGNVKVGTDIAIDALKEHYDAIIITMGAETDKKLGIPGEDLDGSFAATEFVGWYNGHPDYQSRTFPLHEESVVVIGQGNVAVDVTRILAKTPNELSTSDITENAFNALKKSRVKHIYMVGRRGPIQAAFTTLEIQELGNLEDCDIIVNPADLQLSDADKEELYASPRAQKNYDILQGFSNKKPEGKSKTIHIKFFRSPIAIEGSPNVHQIDLGVTELSGDAGSQKATLTDKRDRISCGFVLRSVGYRGLEMPSVPFDDQRGVIPNINGKVDGTSNIYVAGWIKRGPSGVLGTNKPDSSETVKTLLSDLDSLTPCVHRDSDILLRELTKKKVRVVTLDDWKKIDAEEIKRGEKNGKPREKMTSIEEVLRFLDQ